MHEVEEVLAGVGGVASYSLLQGNGISRRAVQLALRSGRITRDRQGWFALPDASDALVKSVRVGGRLSCLSILRQHDIWCVDDHRLHIAVGRHSGHLSSPLDRSVPLGNPDRLGIVIHRDLDSPHLQTSDTAVDGLLAALINAVRCQDRDNAVVVLDSVLNRRLITHHELAVLLSFLPKKYSSYLELVDPSAQSGLETKARLGLRGRGIGYRTQVSIPRVGCVDILIGDRLVLELDGHRWHSGVDAFEEDRRRDLVLHELGYIVIRVSYNQVMRQWDWIERVVRAYVARGEHQWAVRHRRAGLTPS